MFNSLAWEAPTGGKVQKKNAPWKDPRGESRQNVVWKVFLVIIVLAT